MSTHVDGAPPSVSPDPDDGEPERPQSGLDDGSQWVRAEIQRRMAENRSSRGRHARRSASTDDAAGRGARDSPQRDPVVPANPPQTVPLPPPGFVAAGDLPENYVPRHSVQTPGPAAEPAPPITGPIPIVRPAAGDPAGAPDAERRGPVGGPSLPPTGAPLPVRKKRGGPGTPLQSGGSAAAGAWSRPGGSVVPSSEPVQRLGAPPGIRGGAEPMPPWGVPTSPPRGFVATPAPADPDLGPAAPGPAGAEVVPPVVQPDAEPGAEQPAVGAADPVVADGAEDVPDADLVDADPVDADPVVADPVVADADLGDADADLGDADPADLAGAAADDDPEPDEPATRRADGSPAATDGDRDPAEATTAVLPVLAAKVPDPAVPDRAVAPPARRAGMLVQRPPARSGAPRPVTPRNIPVVGTAPPEPGSTRVRVVLSERKGVARPVRTIKEVQEGTAVGEMLRRDLIRSQLLVTLRFGALAVLVLGTLPAILTLLPAVGRFDVFGLRVPWLLLGVLMYPFLVGVAWRYTRVADRVEQDFADHVQD